MTHVVSNMTIIAGASLNYDDYDRVVTGGQLAGFTLLGE
jgi:hypothetical protein